MKYQPKQPRPVTICACGKHAFVKTSKWPLALVSTRVKHILEDRAWSAAVSCQYAFSALGYLHHIVMGSRQRFDHKNGNGCDCRFENLRPANRKQNSRNVKRHKDKKGSKYKGVHPLPSGRWCARIYGKYIGTYDTEIDAAVAYDIEAVKRFGKFARPNIKL